MSDDYLISIRPGDSRPQRKLIIQRWFRHVAEAFASDAESTVGSGGYLIDVTPADDKPTVSCADVAWVKESATQLAS